MDPLSNNRKPAGSVPVDKVATSVTRSGMDLEGGTWLEMANLTAEPPTGQSELNTFELEAVPEPYQTVVECIFILSSVLALLCNISALVLISRRRRRSSRRMWRSQSPRLPSTVSTAKLAPPTGTPATSSNHRHSHGSFGNSSHLRMYLVNLFVNDILIALFTTPFGYTDFMYGQWIYPPLLCPLTNFISTCAVSVSVYTLIAIGLERYFAIIYPLRKLTFFESHTRWIIVCIWTIGIALGIPTLVQSRAVPFYFRNQILLDCREMWEQEVGGKVYTGVLFGATFLVPVVALTFLYVSIAIKTFRHVIPGNADASRDQIQLRNKIRMIKMLVVLVFTFIVCWFPIQTFNMVMWLCDRCRRSFTTPLQMQVYVGVTFVCQWLSIAHSMLDPIIYCFNKRNFKLRRVIGEVHLLARLMLCFGERSDSGHLTPTTSYQDHSELHRASFSSTYSSGGHHPSVCNTSSGPSKRCPTREQSCSSGAHHASSIDAERDTLKVPSGTGLPILPSGTSHGHNATLAARHVILPPSEKVTPTKSHTSKLLALVSRLVHRDHLATSKNVLIHDRVDNWNHVTSI